MTNEYAGGLIFPRTMLTVFADMALARLAEPEPGEECVTWPRSN
jgi:hypothetical protein